MKRFLSLILSIIFCASVVTTQAQMSYGGEPFSFKGTVSQVVPIVELEALDATNLLAEDAITPKGQALRIGVTKEVAISIANNGRLDILPNGDRLWRLAFHAQNATFLSMNFSEFNIPDRAELYFYSPDREFVIGKFTNKNRMEDGRFYPQEMPVDKIIVEYYEPADAAFRGEFFIDQISQGYRNFLSIANKAIEGGIGTADGNCHPNAICKDAQWHAQINSVVCYTMTAGGYLYMCTGAMINNTARNNKPYCLSADHCYTSGATYKFYYLYQATTCTGNNGSTFKCAIGGTVRARANSSDNIYTSSDFMLLEVTGTINPAWDVYLAGWDCGTATPTNATSCGAIHHPGGDIKKFSTPTNIRNGAQLYSNTGNYWATNWGNNGTTEQGSSGSPLFNKNKLIVGQLQGGSSACDYTQGVDFYGKLSYSWTNNNNSSNAKKLKPWLDPNNTGATTLQGQWMPGAPSAITENEAPTLRVFPNPSNGNFTIQGDFTGNEGVCHIYNLTGALVYRKNITLNNVISLNLKDLTPGIYFLEIGNQQNLYRTKIVIGQ